MPTLSEFIATVNTNGLAVSNQYIVQINIPEAMQVAGLDSRTISLYCKQVNIPGVSVNSALIQNVVLPWENAHSIAYTGFNCNFYVDADLKMRRFFELWMSLIYDPYTHSLGWYDEYIADIVVYVLNREQSTVYKYTIQNAFPKTIGGNDLAYGNNEGVMNLSIDFSFQYVVTEQYDVQKNSGVDVLSHSSSTSPFCSFLIEPDSSNPMTFVMPDSGGSQNTMLSGIMGNNSWIDKGMQTAGNIMSAYRGAVNSMDDITGSLKRAKELVNSAKSGNVNQVFGAVTQLGGLVKNNPITRATGSDGLVANASSILSKLF